VRARTLIVNALRGLVKSAGGLDRVAARPRAGGHSATGKDRGITPRLQQPESVAHQPWSNLNEGSKAV
jgi:hypothetical protein